ncbi:hypothetical protein KKA03_03235 [archaeon]|nr:hypothetical protein [archaeon]
MTDILQQIDEYVAATIKALSPEQAKTLKALLLAGYRGERDYILLELLKHEGASAIAHSGLTESFIYKFEHETADYSRIKPEFYRSVRKHLSK